MSRAEQDPGQGIASSPGREPAFEAGTGWAVSGGKRIFDLALALPLLLVSLPVLVLLGLGVRATSSGPAFFAQPRVGRYERRFVCLKLRSMRQGTPSVATHEAPRSAVTPLGQFLRASKLDELPQLWSVVKGEMSLVGPRPCLENQTELVHERRVRGVYALRPGITGLAQVRGIDMSVPEICAAQDAEYAVGASLKLDLWLLTRTFLPRRWFQGAAR